LANFPVAYCGLKIITSLRSVSLIFSEGAINYQSLFALKNTNTTEAEIDNNKQAKQKPWNILVNDLAIHNYSLNFTDKTVTLAAQIDLTSINIKSSQLSTEKSAILPLNLDFVFNGTGKISLAGKTRLKPLSSQIDLTIKDLALKEFQPCVNKFARLDIVSGLFNIKANINLQEKQGKPLAIIFKADSHIIDNVITRDKVSNNDFIKWKKLNISKINVNTTANSYNIDTIKLDKLYSRVLIRKDKSININDILISAKNNR
jgi:hypothetical protein